MNHVVIREYARLTASRVAVSTMDEASVSPSAFDWLCRESARLRKSGANLVHLDGCQWLRWDSYVGVIETPCGTRVEVLPKCSQGIEDAANSRRLLRQMLLACLDLPAREASPASLQFLDAPLTEWVIRQFLQALEHLVKRGIRFDYRAVKEQQRFLRGRLDLDRQLRQPPGRQHLFHIEHDVFEPERPENRLLRSALARVCDRTRDVGNWRLSHELMAYLAPMPESRDVEADFRKWGNDRLMAHYRPLRPWCTLILNDRMPLSLLGEWRGMSLLFPMEKVFERYVESCLRAALPDHARLTASASSEYLCRHRDRPWFLLKPDFFVSCADRRWVLDTKWKLIDQQLCSREEKYGLSQADFYQLFAYGQRYLSGEGDMVLVYPQTARFNEPLPPFAYSDKLRLWVVPFDLASGRLGTDLLPRRDAALAA